MRRLLVTASIVLLATAAHARALPAQDAGLDARTRAVASELRCPVCQGTSILDSPAPLAVEMRDVVREQLQQGKSPEEIKRYFAARYGEWVLLRPAARGANAPLYVLPILAFVVGVIWVTRSVRRRDLA